MPERLNRPGSHPLILGVALLALHAPLVLAAPPGAAPREYRMFLSAGAPWGEPGARAEFGAACGDTVSRDTLYLSFEPPADDTAFVAFQGEVYIYAQPGDTLGNFWSMERGARNNGGLIIQFGPDGTFPQPQPWTTQGLGSVAYDRTAQSGRLRFVFAVPYTHPEVVKAGRRYVLGRIILGAKRGGLEGCVRPVCLEWHTASFGYLGRPMEKVNSGGSRWLSRGATGAECRDRIPAWRPKSAPAGTPVVPPEDPR